MMNLVQLQLTSVKWAPNGRHVAADLNNFDAQLWDSTNNTLSLDVCILASAASDETLRFWNVIRTPEVKNRYRLLVQDLCFSR
ncbi:unnamed protein product [Cuscuta campestris]|uniref:Anaphase-promoting complex subunit 4 WD40 domain-containing protein n=1 Tax=Cuscuta campestris TaxID=132261 RepID=A0A484MMZ6_9ASTE|nr:unnamed protein product [Cuscuta campestris]